MSIVNKLRALVARGGESKSPQVSLSQAVQSGAQATVLAPVRSNEVSRPPLEKYYSYIAIALAAYMTADLGIMYFRDRMIPKQAPPANPVAPPQIISKLRQQYNTITQRNIFNSDGLIPPALSAPESPAGPGGEQNLDGPAIPTSLPINLLGTIVHKNPAKSVATIEVRGGKILPFVPNDDMEGLGTLIKVERKRAIFRNSQSGRNEYVEIKDKAAITFGLRGDKPGGPTEPVTGDFSFSKTEVNNLIKNLPELLQQARSEPVILPNGKVDGFRITDIMPGSIYEKLGLLVGDVIKSVNGRAIDSPATALELYNQLRNSDRIAVEVDRNGTKQTLNYTIN